MLYGNNDEVTFVTRAKYLSDSLVYATLGEKGFSQFTDDQSRSKALNDLIANNRSLVYTSWYPFTIRHRIVDSSDILIYESDLTSYSTINKNMFDWEIHEERDSILGLEVLKASIHYAGRYYIAWFAPSIPIKYGPYLFKGLPGLILKIADVNNFYVFEAKKISGSSTRYFYPALKNKHLGISKNDFISKLKNELYSSSPDFLDILNESKSERLQSQIDQAKRNSKKWYLLMELY
jgi:GLPGLI family protein